MQTKWNDYRTNNEVFESRISAGATEKILVWEKPHAKTSAWSHDMEGHAQKCVEGHCELANKKVEQLFQVSSPCLDDHHFKQEELESDGELPELANFLEMPVLGTNWTTRYSMVSEQTCTINHKVDQGL